MFSSNYTKFFFLALAAILLFSTCRFWQTESEKPNQLEPESQGKQTAPFSTQEPRIYQAEIVIKTFLNGGKNEKKHFVAKNERANLLTFNFGEENETTLLESADGKHFVINKGNRTYLEKIYEDNNGKPDELKNFLTTKWLNEKREAKFESLGIESGIAKYRVTIDDSKKSEIVIFIDEKLQIPMKQEFYSVSGGKKELTYSIEIKDFKPEAPEKLFVLPDDYREQTTKNK